MINLLFKQRRLKKISSLTFAEKRQIVIKRKKFLNFKKIISEIEKENLISEDISFENY